MNIYCTCVKPRKQPEPSEAFPNSVTPRDAVSTV